MAKIALNVDGKSHTIEADNDMPLLYALRDDLGLRNPKFGCGLAQCGACTVIIDGVAVRSCVTPVDSVQNTKITTLAGLGGGKAHALQEAFIAEQVPQCGFCISGVIMAASVLLKKNSNPTDAEIDAIADGYRNEFRRGNDSLYWEDVGLGDTLPVVQKGPLTLVDIVGFYSGRRTVYNVMKLAFADRDKHPSNVYYSPTRNIPMHPAAGHFDVEIAHEIGMPAAYDQGWQRIGWAGHMLTNWCGDSGFVRRLDGRVTKPNLIGDLTKLTGEVVAKRKTEALSGMPAESLIDIRWWGENQRGERNCNGEATVRLPSRDINQRC